jgi:outer membrane protein
MSHVSCPIVGAEGFKIGYVDMGKVFDGYERTKQSESVLEKKGQQKEAELEQRLDELKKMRQGLELLNDETRESRARDLEKKADELRRFGTNTKEDLLKERNAIAREILKDIQKAVEDYAKANGFSLILEESSLLYGQEAYDVTEDVLKHLNQRHAAGAKSTATR